MTLKGFIGCAALALYIISLSLGIGSCAQIGAPTGGPRDSTAPRLIMVTPGQNSTNFTAKRIVFTFDEYIVLDNVQKNLLVSPYPKVSPIVDYKLKTITVKLRDTLQPNTTYSINFGDAIKDNNEANPYKNLTYVFSTGSNIDSLQLAGEVILAETGKRDSTLIALLYKDTHDTTVRTRKPNYIARVDAAGKFNFTNLSEGRYKIYALKDNDGGKTYNYKTELFAFYDSSITISSNNAPVTLYAYAEEKDNRRAAPARVLPEKKLQYKTSLLNGQQGLINQLSVTFNRPIKTMDEQKLWLMDTLQNRLPGSKLTIDSTQKIVTLQYPWKEETDYRLVIDQAFITDTMGVQLAKSDTIKFKTKKISDYGSVLLRFSNLDVTLHPVLQFIKGDELVKSVPLTNSLWSDKLVEPGEYDLRILYDSNQNGKWDPGNYNNRLQPERAITISTEKKLNVRANWDNERDIKL
jgi:uncharacterized protein (DUF2141 family)